MPRSMTRAASSMRSRAMQVLDRDASHPFVLGASRTWQTIHTFEERVRLR
ncbi:MAG: hypothetical protein GY859_20270 [Desulfobacterales bacterium]|nr:hypothetical protein [Desulfobacterales bacterium]